MKHILLYNPIVNVIAEEFITAINDADGDDITIRVNSPGGSVFAGWGMAAAMQESESKITVKIDGLAASMAFFIMLFADNVEALDVSQVMMHRATGKIESEEDQKLLDSVNAALRAKMEDKFDGETFQAITGVSISDMFENEDRKNVWITAKQAKKIGLVNKINRLSISEQTAMSKMVASSEIAESFGFIEEDNTPTDNSEEIISVLDNFTKNL